MALTRRFWRDDVRWFGPRGVVDLSSRAVAFLLRGGSQGDADLYVMINGGPDRIPFVLQDRDDHWRVVVDPSRRSPDDIDPEGRQPLARPSFIVEGRSVVVLVR
jgi:pullulanase/glycogen debranching enzyme